jgi:transposase
MIDTDVCCCIVYVLYSVLPVHTCSQGHCTICNEELTSQNKHGTKCITCHNQQHRTIQHTFDSTTSEDKENQPTPSSSVSMFGRMNGCIDQLTLIERAAIITLDQLKWKHGDIAQKIHCSENTISIWVNRWKDNHSLEDSDRSGRPRSTDDDTDLSIMLYSNTHHTAVPSNIGRELELDVSTRTIRRRLSEIDLHTYVQHYESEFLLLHRKRRIAFAEGYSRWSDDEWSRVLWSDHSLFTLDYQTREYVIRPPGHAHDPEYIGVKEKHEGAVWLWGCISAQGLGHAELYVDTLDAAHYQRILKLNLVKSAQTFWPKGMWYFQQDNASPHTAGTSQIWFHNHGITLLDFPPYSSDLSPIENLWSDLKRRVYAHHPKTMEELEDWISKEWQATDLNFISHICRSMPKRLQLLLDNHGHKISY